MKCWPHNESEIEGASAAPHQVDYSKKFLTKHSAAMFYVAKIRVLCIAYSHRPTTFVFFFLSSLYFCYGSKFDHTYFSVPTFLFKYLKNFLPYEIIWSKCALKKVCKKFLQNFFFLVGPFERNCCWICDVHILHCLSLDFTQQLHPFSFVIMIIITRQPLLIPPLLLSISIRFFSLSTVAHFLASI